MVTVSFKRTPTLGAQVCLLWERKYAYSGDVGVRWERKYAYSWKEYEFVEEVPMLTLRKYVYFLCGSVNMFRVREGVCWGSKYAQASNAYLLV